MQNKALLWVIVILLLVIIGGGAFLFLTGNSGQTTVVSTTSSPSAATTLAPATTATSQALSEQPDQATYAKYFSDVHLGKLALGVSVGPPNGMPTKATSFTASTDQLCTDMVLIKPIPAGSFSTATYDTVAKADIQPKASPGRALSLGGNDGCESITYPAGQYERKIYINDVLAAVLPFSIK